MPNDIVIFPNRNNESGINPFIDFQHGTSTSVRFGVTGDRLYIKDLPTTADTQIITVSAAGLLGKKTENAGGGGTSGTSGNTGASGSSGTSGTRGTSGTSGTRGTSGTSGNTGASGSAGTSGTSGVSITSDGFSTTVNSLLSLIHNDETSSTEHVSSVVESADLKSFSLPANNYEKILIEAVIQSRQTQDADSRTDFTWRIKVGGSTVATFTPRTIGSSTTSIDSGGQYVNTISHIINGGQGSTTTLSITAQNSVSNAAVGSQVLKFRVYAISTYNVGSTHLFHTASIIQYNGTGQTNDQIAKNALPTLKTGMTATIPANKLANGNVIKFKGNGLFQFSDQGNFRIILKIGGYNLSTTINEPTVASPIANGSQPWFFEGQTVINTAGSSATVYSNSRTTAPELSYTDLQDTRWGFLAAKHIESGTLNTTISNDIEFLFSGNMGTASSEQHFSTRYFEVDIL